MDFVTAIRELFNYIVGRIEFLIDFITDSAQITSLVVYIWNICIPIEVKYIFEFSIFMCLLIWFINLFLSKK